MPVPTRAARRHSQIRPLIASLAALTLLCTAGAPAPASHPGEIPPGSTGSSTGPRRTDSRPWLFALGAATSGLLAGGWILHQRRTIRRLARSEERLRALIEHGFDLTLVVQPDGRIIEASPATRRILRLRENLGPGSFATLADGLHPDDRSRVETGLRHAGQGPASPARIEAFRIIGPDGSPRWVEAVAATAPARAGVDGLILHLHDIHEQQAAYRRVEQAAELQRRLNEFATSLSPLHDEDAILWEITRQCISLLGFVDCVIYLVDPTRQVLVQKAAYGPKNPRDRQILNPIEIPVGHGIVGTVAATGRPERIADTRVDPRYIVDDTPRLSELAVPIGTGGEVLGVIDSEHPALAFFTEEHLTILTSIASLCANKLIRARTEQRLRDLNLALETRVTERTRELLAANDRLRANADRLRQAEEELIRNLAQERELNQLKTRFVSMVSHELRNPLAVVMCSADILANYLDELPEPERSRHLQAIHDSAGRMARLMEEVLLLGRVDAGRIVVNRLPLDLPLACRRTVDQVLTASGQRCPIEIHAGQDLAGALGDENLLGHILTNLLTNAVKYSPAGVPVRLQVARDGADAVFTVADRGIGIRVQDGPHLFEAFFRGSNAGHVPGTGLGLVIARRCAEIYGGSIRYQSREGEGTTFEVRLPLFSPGSAHPNPPAPPS